MDHYTNQYLVLVVFFAVAIVFASLPIVLAKIVAPKKPSTIKQDTYECGLEARGDPWIQLNVQYYVYALAFVAFDLEAPFLYLWAVVFHKMPISVFIEMLVFIAVLMVGLIYAWRKGVLEWDVARPRGATLRKVGGADGR
jgi:NADH:ubiquinone oxidoreductase subunit 3 (subunit A)